MRDVAFEFKPQRDGGCGSRMAKIWPFFGLAIVSRCNAWFPVVIRGLIGRFAVLLGPAHERYEHAPGPVKAIGFEQGAERKHALAALTAPALS